MNEKGRYTKYARDIATVPMCASLIIISSWISIPLPVSFTLQTLAIFTVCLLFDLKISFTSVFLYVLIGVVGLPVFSGFGAGISSIIGPTGGFILSFLLFPFLIGLIKKRSYVLAMSVCTLVCYIIGTLWFYFVYGADGNASFISILSICVLPFIVTDIFKIALAYFICKRLSKIKFFKQ